MRQHFPVPGATARTRGKRKQGSEEMGREDVFPADSRESSQR